MVHGPSSVLIEMGKLNLYGVGAEQSRLIGDCAEARSEAMRRVLVFVSESVNSSIQRVLTDWLRLASHWGWKEPFAPTAYLTDSAQDSFRLPSDRDGVLFVLFHSLSRYCPKHIFKINLSPRRGSQLTRAQGNMGCQLQGQGDNGVERITVDISEQLPKICTVGDSSVMLDYPLTPYSSSKVTAGVEFNKTNRDAVPHDLADICIDTFRQIIGAARFNASDHVQNVRRLNRLNQLFTDYWKNVFIESQLNIVTGSISAVMAQKPIHSHNLKPVVAVDVLSELLVICRVNALSQLVFGSEQKNPRLFERNFWVNAHRIGFALVQIPVVIPPIFSRRQDVQVQPITISKLFGFTAVFSGSDLSVCQFHRGGGIWRVFFDSVPSGIPSNQRAALGYYVSLRDITASKSPVKQAYSGKMFVIVYNDWRRESRSLEVCILLINQCLSNSQNSHIPSVYRRSFSDTQLSENCQ